MKRPQISRVSRTKEEARAAYNRLSGVYDLLAHPFEKKYKQRGLDLLNARSGEAILEIGFGTGNNLLSIARAVGKQGKVQGIDIADEMVKVARKKLEEEGLSGIVELRRGDATVLPYEKKSFDAIFMSFVLELFDNPDIPTVLAECRRVLRPGGRLVNVSLKKADTLANGIYERLHEAFPALLDCRPIMAGQALQQAGFQVEEEQEFSLFGLHINCVLAKA